MNQILNPEPYLGPGSTRVRGYDYIIVGAGSAGCVLAYRLSERPDVSVLLIEAGPTDKSRFIRMPRGYLKTHADPRLRWVFPVTADAGEWRGGFIGGKVLGGTSSINSMVYVRGQPQDYDDWALSGAPGWSWNDIAPCFKKIEDHELGEIATRGAGGPLHVSLPRADDRICAALIEAGVALGLPYKEDLNELDQEGIGYLPTTIKRGRRMSAARAFLTPSANRPNLTILTDTTVCRIVFDGKRAVGVALARKGVLREFRAGREIVLCAGALQSPKLLQLSGIGPADHLRSLGIPIMCDSPGVGGNLRDHWGLRLRYKLRDASGRKQWPRRLALYGNMARYFIRGDGILSTAVTQIGAFIKVSHGADRTDAQLEIAPYPFVPGGAISECEPQFQCSVRSLRPQSQGSVLIRSTDPAQSPTIRANVLSAEYDRRLTVNMVGFTRRLLGQPPLREFLAEETFPGPTCRSDDEIVDLCRRAGIPGSHFAGTCKIGEAPLGVVDERLRVRGVAGLRVVDASVMPTLVSGNTNGPVMAIAWRAADLIQAETLDPSLTDSAAVDNGRGPRSLRVSDRLSARETCRLHERRPSSNGI